MSCRHAEPSNNNTINAERAELAETTDLSAGSARSAFDVRGSVGNGGHLSRVERLEESARVFELKFRVPRLDAQEEPVAAREGKARHVENGVIRHRQAVERQHAEHG